MATKFPTLVKEESLDQFNVKKGLQDLQDLNKIAIKQELTERLHEVKKQLDTPVLLRDGKFEWNPKTGDVSATFSDETIGKTLSYDDAGDIITRWYGNDYEPTMRPDHERNRDLAPEIPHEDKDVQEYHVKTGLDQLKRIFSETKSMGGGDPISLVQEESIPKTQQSIENVVYPVIGYDLKVNNPFGGEQYRGPTIGSTENFPTKNSGVDLFAPKNTPLVSPRKGTVLQAGKSNVTGAHHGYGNSVLIQADDGYVHRLSHLNKIQIKKGDKLLAGDVIGLSGDTGNTTGPHLDYELYTPDGVLVDATRQFNLSLQEASGSGSTGGAFSSFRDLKGWLGDLFTSNETKAIQEQGNIPFDTWTPISGEPTKLPWEDEETSLPLSHDDWLDQMELTLDKDDQRSHQHDIENRTLYGRTLTSDSISENLFDKENIPYKIPEAPDVIEKKKIETVTPAPLWKSVVGGLFEGAKEINDLWDILGFVAWSAQYTSLSPKDDIAQTTKTIRAGAEKIDEWLIDIQKEAHNFC